MSQLNKASDIAALLKTRMQAITIANGYNTDIGTRVLMGRRKIDASHVPCVVIIEGDDEPTREADSRMEIPVDLDFVFSAYVLCDPDHPNDAAHLAIKDIKRALWDRNTMGGNLGRKVVSFKYRGKNIGPAANGEDSVAVLVYAQVRYAEALDDA